MNISTKLLKAAAGSAGGAGLDVDEVFSTFLYDGTSADLSINNGIDLSGEGGLVWFKDRNYANNHRLYDTARGVRKYLDSSSTAVEATNTGSGNSNGISAFNSNGFTIGNDGYINDSSSEYVSWTFRKAPKFFDVVTWTGDGTAGRSISHSLNSPVGMILVKRRDGSEDWKVLHRNDGSTWKESTSLSTDTLSTPSNGRFGDASSFVAPTSTAFTVNTSINSNTDQYVAYLFAHNNSDGTFGPDGDQDIIKCGSYTGNGSSTGPVVNLGFEPQFLMVKRSDATNNWVVFDSMRGFTVGTNSREIMWNLSDAEQARPIEPTSTGFQPTSSATQTNASGGTYIYMAIRRGPLAAPTDATKVFAIDTGNGNGSSSSPEFVSGFPVDLALLRPLTSGNNDLYSRLTANKYLSTNSTSSEATNATDYRFDSNTGWFFGSTTWTSWMWKRAPGYFDVCCYQGTGSAGFTFNHNLGVKPEMIWVKNRGASEYWAVYHKDLNGGTNPSHYYLKLNDTNAEFDYNEIWNDTEPTATQVTVGQQGVVNSSSFSHIAYLFATVAGVSKVGSFTYTSGSAQNIDCGFSSGARFVLYKRYSGTSAWTLFDTTRGIVAGNDAMLMLNTTSAEDSNYDFIDPYSSGFALSDSTANLSGDYIFLAIA